MMEKPTYMESVIGGGLPANQIYGVQQPYTDRFQNFYNQNEPMGPPTEEEWKEQQKEDTTLDKINKVLGSVGDIVGKATGIFAPERPDVSLDEREKPRYTGLAIGVGLVVLAGGGYLVWRVTKKK